MANYIDIANQKFGRLTALNYVGNSKWECICDCGNTTITTSYNLRMDKTKSCGCLDWEVKNSPRIDISGRRFGKLTAVRYDGSRRWECQCDCGNTTFVPTQRLTSGKTKSCGCLCIKGEIGEKFNRLTIIERVGKRRLCRCDCGNICIVSGYKDLVNGNTKSCGCQRTEKNKIKVSNFSENKLRNQYEELFGEVSEDMIVTALDGNTSNTNGDNMMAVSRSTYKYLSNNHLLGCGEITKTAIITHQLGQKIREYEK